VGLNLGLCLFYSSAANFFFFHYVSHLKKSSCIRRYPVTL